MYDNVIVPFDSSLELRAALAPAADLAWRCRAKIVVVNTTPAADEESRLVLKSQAISMSGADVDFWVDLDVEVGDALVQAVRHRSNPIVCVASRERRTGLLGKRVTVVPPPAQVFTDVDVPVLVVGPRADVSRGLNMVEVLVLDDGSTTAGAMAFAVAWGRDLRVDVRVVAVVAEGDEAAVERARQRFADQAADFPGATLEIFSSDRPAATLVALADRRIDSVVVVGRSDPSPGAPMGALAGEVIATCPRFVVVAPAGP